MNINYKLYFRYIFFDLSHLYLNHDVHGSKNISLVIPKNVIYYLVSHFRFATSFYLSQLVDLFAYELPLISSDVRSFSSNKSVSNSVLVYNFHNLVTHDRFFLFCVDIGSHSPKSISEFYPNANWLEREVSELHGTVFDNKRDLRNLMLQYGDTSTPFRKSSPSIGLKEFFFDSVNDSLVQLPLSVQV